MRSKIWTVAFVLLVLTAMPALAGECSSSKAAQAASANGHANGKLAKGHGCSADTQLCLNKMAAKLRDKGWVGVELDAAEGGGYVITRVESYSPALEAGLQQGDVLVAVNGVRINDENEEALMQIKSEMRVGKTLKYTIDRSGREKNVKVTLAEIPEAVMAKWIGQHMLQHASIEMAAN